LGVIRALGNKKIHIVAMPYGKSDFAQVSKYVSEKVTVPHPRLEEEQFIDFLISNSNRWKGAFIIETDDNSAVSIAKHKNELSKHYFLASLH
ncbi:unnamed protein product, partial [marine sediment metagenome]